MKKFFGAIARYFVKLFAAPEKLSNEKKVDFIMKSWDRLDRHAKRRIKTKLRKKGYNI